MARRPAPATRRPTPFGRRRRPGGSRRSFTIVLLVLASITIITLDYRGGGRGVISGLKRVAHDVFSPVQRDIDAIFRPIGSFLSGAVHYGAVEQQNAKLRYELGRSNRELLAGQAQRQTLQDLTRLEHLPWVDNIPTVMAQVVALNPSDFATIVQLDAGTARGVEAGMPVVGGSGLVGVVSEAWSSGSYVELITDASSTIGVRFGNNLADVQGRGANKTLAVNLVAPGTPGLYRGEILTTSGLANASFPPDLPVARVKSFTSSPSSTQETVIATPLADLSALQYVDVMQWEPSS